MKRLMVGVVVVVAFVFSLSISASLAQDACEGNFDCDQDINGTDAAKFKEDFGRSPFLDPCPPKGDCCNGTLSDSCRGCDQGNVTVKDMTTGLIWLQDASCMGQMSWESAIEQPIINLRSGDCSGTLSDGSVWGD